MNKKIKSRSKDDSKFEKLKDIVLKINQNEKRKAENRKKEKSQRPRGYRSRKAGVVAFWITLAFMFLFVLVNVGGNDKKESANVSGAVIKAEKATSAEAIEFAKSFLSHYLTWNSESSDIEERAEKMGFYTTEDLARELANVKDDHWNSALSRESILLKNIKNLGGNKALLTFQTNVAFTKTEEGLRKEVQQLSAKQQPTTNTASSAEPAAPVIPTTENFGAGSLAVAVTDKGVVKSITKKKFISVPVFYDEDTQRYIVYEIPAFTNFDESPNKENIESETAGLIEVTGVEVQEEIDFLNTFFESFANDPPEKLSYFLEDKTYQNGLNHTMRFEKVEESHLYEGKTKNEKIVLAKVAFSEPDTGIMLHSQYTLVIKQKEDRFVVTHMNDLKYMKEVLKQKSSVADSNEK
ncbi:conjugal transfer protein [Bacillus badius]|uniref:conjugal transfer protein n=2 Tax=Bacillus badius TaxID=1455 RepID=UPI001CC0AE0E|nr:conjugal transfer protein [Bacillus badius]UAT32459.1 conjugal transfer protein [Bacillus badius]GLY12702.1 hypothetical protein Bbad01_39180 [Bacillus badius]